MADSVGVFRACRSCAVGGSLWPLQKANVLRVIDGNTVHIEVSIWPGLSQRTKLRLAGVNTPEKRGRGISDCEKRAGHAATAFTRRFLKKAQSVMVSGIRPVATSPLRYPGGKASLLELVSRIIRLNKLCSMDITPNPMLAAADSRSGCSMAGM